MTNNINQIQNNFMQEYGNIMQYHWKYYTGDKSVIPVFKRTSASPLKQKSHTNKHVDYYGDIIDLKQGYMGEAIEINYKGEQEIIIDSLNSFIRSNKLKVLNSQTIEISSVEGISHRLLYTKDGFIKSKNLHGWQVVYDYEDDIYDPDFAYYFYSEQALSDTEPTNYCNVYDRTNVYYFRQEKVDKRSMQKAQDNYGGAYILQDEQPHNFNQVPIAPFPNTSNWEGNCFQAVGLMDLYDEIMSDTAGELKAARLAYLKLWGDLQTGKNVNGDKIPIPDYLREFGTMIFKTDAEGKPMGDASFLEKTIDDAAVEHMLDRLRSHIYEVSSSIDLKELSAAERVFSIRASIMRPENNAMTTENYFITGMNKIIDLWLYWLKEYNNIKIDGSEFEVIVGRVFPQDAEAQAKIFSIYAPILAIEDALKLAEISNAKEISNNIDDVIVNDDTVI